MGNWEWRLQHQNKCNAQVVNCKQKSIHVVEVGRRMTLLVKKIIQQLAVARIKESEHVHVSMLSVNRISSHSGIELYIPSTTQCVQTVIHMVNIIIVSTELVYLFNVEFPHL